MFDTLIIKWIAAAILAAAFSAGIYAGYAHIKQIGYDEAVAVYKKRDEAMAERLNEHIHTLEALSNSIVQNNNMYMNKFNKDIKNILFTVKGLTPYIVVDGKCLPSPAFNDAYNALLRKANE